MKNIANPFCIIDNLLLDCVFNPLCWWSEDAFEKDAMHLRWYGIIFSSMVVAAAAASVKMYVMFYVLFVLLTLHYYFKAFARRMWVLNTKTGKNILRVTDFLNRTFDLVILICALVASVDSVGISLIILGASGLTVLPKYFEATDAMPPGYHRHKLAWNPQ